MAAPTITGISPSCGEQGETLTVRIYGTGFTGTFDVWFDSDITVDSFEVISDTEVSVEITILSEYVYGGTYTYVGLENPDDWAEESIFMVFPFSNVVNCSSSCTVVSEHSAGGFIGGIETGGSPS